MRESSDYEIGIVFTEDEVQTLLKTRMNFWKKLKNS